MKSFALALGGGGARGIAHIAMIEALDELGVRPLKSFVKNSSPRRCRRTSARSRFH